LQDSKSGNLNFGLSRSRGELILVLDADQVPAPEILTRLAGFFRLPRLAYVQTKQAFFLPDGDPFYNRDEVFYDVVQPSNDQANAVLSCGSGVLYRRRALEEMGGFATWNILEDVTTSYELLSRGWKGIYFPYALTRGLAPHTLAGVYRQRFQWSLDTMRLFFWDNPLWKPGLTFGQRRHFLLVMLSYLVSGLAFPLFCMIPIFVYWRGSPSLLGQETVHWGLRGAYLLATILMFRYLFYGRQPLKQVKIMCGLFPVYGVAVLAALFYPPGRKPRYRVNNRHPFVASGPWWPLSPYLGFIILHFTLPFLSLWLGWAMPKLIAFNAVFSAVIIWLLADLVLAAGAKPHWRPARDPRRVYGA
jgi:cellulose synthase (UDP-forming)